MKKYGLVVLGVVIVIAGGCFWHFHNAQTARMDTFNSLEKQVQEAEKNTSSKVDKDFYAGLITEIEMQKTVDPNVKRKSALSAGYKIPTAAENRAAEIKTFERLKEAAKTEKQKKEYQECIDDIKAGRDNVSKDFTN